MRNPDDLLNENQALRERLSKLSEASIRITEDLDLDIVLQGVVDGARFLTGARMGGITALDEQGQLQDFITSGLTPEEHERFLELPGGPEFFSYLSMIPGPLRLADFSGHTTSAGLPAIDPPLGPVGTFLGAPISHRGEHAGNFYLSDKEGGLEFTQEDEDTLLMFASQAAMAIANARRYREEQRARADLETLVNTSPVGVVLFDARTGAPVSLNREARRIVDGLRNPDQLAEDLLATLTLRRADGREISLRDFPLAQALSTGETIRAEEIVLQVPDGRRITTIINATPIPTEDGGVESVIVTMQDMTSLEELERLRAEFLGMVSHELRAPLTSIRGSAETLMDASDSLDPAEMRQFHRIIREQADQLQGLITDLLDVARIDAGTLAVAPESSDIAVLVDRARNTFLSGGNRRDIQLDLPPDLPRVMADRRRIVQVLSNLLSNAARHSPAGYPIRVEAAPRGVQVEISVSDDGAGLAAERLPHLFRRFSRPGADDPGERNRRYGFGPGHLQGDSGGPRGPHLGQKRGAGPGVQVRLHPTGSGGDGSAGAARVPLRGKGAAEGAGPRGGRRSTDPQVRAGRALGGWLCAPSDRRSRGGGPPHPGGETSPGAAGPDAAGGRRRGIDGERPRACRGAGDLPLGLRQGPGDRAGAGGRGRRLHRQALLAHGAGGEDSGGTPAAGRRWRGPSRRSPTCWGT